MKSKDQEQDQKLKLINDLDVTRKDFIEFELPERKKRVMITITRRHFYDSDKKKIVTDQLLHKAVYGLKKEENKDNKEGTTTT